MKSWVRNSLRAGVLAAGFLLFAATPAQAADQFTADNSGIGSGNNVSVPIAVAGNVCGNGVGVAGAGVGVSDRCASDASNEEAGGTQATTDNSGIGTGNNVSVPVVVAGNVCGNGVGVAGAGIGVSDTCGADASNGAGGGGGGPYERTSSRGEQRGGTQFSGDNSGILTGNNIHVPITAALNACGNGVGVAGVGVGVSDTCRSDASNENTTEIQYTAGNSGILTGNNVHIPITIAANACGNGVGVLGVGVGVSDNCRSDANNGGADDTAQMTGNRAMDRTVESSTEALPVVSAPLPAPVNDVAEKVLGSAPDLSAPTQGNSVNLPV